MREIRKRMATFAIVLGVAGAGWAVALAFGTADAGAAATGGKYHVVFSPSTVPGGAVTNLQVTISEDTGAHLGAANLTPPAGFTALSASLPAGDGSASISGGVVQLRNLTLRPGGSVTATVGALAACAPAQYAWSTAATNDGNFTGAMQTLVTANSKLNTNVVNGCSLSFSAEPANAVVGQVISNTAFEPTGPALQVEVLDGNGNLDSYSSAPISMSLATNPGSGTLSGTTTQTASSGVATFDDLSINQPGTGYELLASSAGITSATSSPFDETSAGTNCSSNPSCQTTTSTSQSTLTVSSSGSGNTLSITVDPGTPLTCSGYTSQDPNWYSFLSSQTSTGKVVTYTVVPSNTGEVDFCLGAPYDFITNQGTMAPPGTLPDGSSGYIGLLPECFQSSSGPCVDSRTETPDSNSVTGYDVTLKVVFPAGLPGDPIGRV